MSGVWREETQVKRGEVSLGRVLILALGLFIAREWRATDMFSQGEHVIFLVRCLSSFRCHWVGMSEYDGCITTAP